MKRLEQFAHQWEALSSLPEREIPLLQGALLIARDEYPELNIGKVAADVHAIAHAILTLSTQDAGPESRLEMLNRHLFEELGFTGNRENYYDPRNSYLNEVLARRTGIPISLAVIYVEIGRLLGLDLQGVGFPGHFLVRLDGADGTTILDPFNAGDRVSMEQLHGRLLELDPEAKIPDPEELLHPTTPRQILVRMLRNLKAVYLAAEDLERALRCADRLVTLLPLSAGEYRDRGTLYLSLGVPHAAGEDYRHYLELDPEAGDRAEIEAQVRDLEQVRDTLH